MNYLAHYVTESHLTIFKEVDGGYQRYSKLSLAKRIDVTDTAKAQKLALHYKSRLSRDDQLLFDGDWDESFLYENRLLSCKWEKFIRERDGFHAANKLFR